MDRHTPEQRTINMRAVRSKNTLPEMRVRRAAHSLGYRFRLHRRDLPGSPDLVFPRYHKVIFVHGCYWHQHWECQDAKVPKSNKSYWQPKLERNAERDARAEQALIEAGWEVLIIWECETKDAELVKERLCRFLG